MTKEKKNRIFIHKPSLTTISKETNQTNQEATWYFDILPTSVSFAEKTEFAYGMEL